MPDRARRLVIGHLTEEVDGDVQSLRTGPAHVHNAFTKSRHEAFRIEERRLPERNGEKAPHPAAGVDECDGDGSADGVGDGVSAGAPEHGSAPVSLM